MWRSNTRFQYTVLFKVELRLCGCRKQAAASGGCLLTCFHERASVTSSAGARGRYGLPARVLCTRSRRWCGKSGRARERAGPRCWAAHCTLPGIQAPGTRLYWGRASLLQKAKRTGSYLIVNYISLKHALKAPGRFENNKSITTNCIIITLH